MLRGRRDECAALEGLLQCTRVAQSSVLVLRGEAGIGKTTLLEFVAAQATGCNNQSPLNQVSRPLESFGAG